MTSLIGGRLTGLSPEVPAAPHNHLKAVLPQLHVFLGLGWGRCCSIQAQLDEPKSGLLLNGSTEANIHDRMGLSNEAALGMCYRMWSVMVTRAVEATPVALKVRMDRK